MSQTGTSKLHADVLASLTSEPRFDWRDADSGIIITDTHLVMHGKDPDRVLRVPLESIRVVALRRGWWETLLSHFLMVSYDDVDGSRTEQVKIARQRGEEAVLSIAEATDGHTKPRFEVAPILTMRLVAGLVLSGLFIFAVGSLRFYFRGDASLVEVLQGTAVIAAAITLGAAMFAFWQ
jgi:hypothetical protein